MSQQLTHQATEFEEKKFPIILVLDRVAGPANIGSLFRLADAFNIEKILLCGPEVDLQTPRIQKTARATIQTVPFEQYDDSLKLCKHLKSQGLPIFALEITDKSLPISSSNFSSYERIVLVVGNENTGIDPEVLQLADKSLHINMFGRNSSMNVAQSAGIALYEITRSLPHLNRNNIFTR